MQLGDAAGGNRFETRSRFEDRFIESSRPTFARHQTLETSISKEY